MPVRISSSDIGAEPSNSAALLAKSGSNATKSAPATQSDIQGILQREQDRAILLLSLSPLLSSLFIAYANKAAALDAASAIPSPESEEWEALRSSVTRMREEIERLKSGASEASRQAFNSQPSTLEEENVTQQEEIRSLRKELLEIRCLYDQLTTDSSAEKAAHKARIEDLETQRTELKQTVAEQQVKISRFEYQVPEDGTLSLVPTRPPPRPPARRKESLTSGQATPVPHPRTPSPETLETISNSSSYSNHARDDNAPKPPSKPSENRPQPVARTSPLNPVPKRQSSHKKSFRGGWLKALNDSF